MAMMRKFPVGCRLISRCRGNCIAASIDRDDDGDRQTERERQGLLFGGRVVQTVCASSTLITSISSRLSQHPSEQETLYKRDVMSQTCLSAILMTMISSAPKILYTLSARMPILLGLFYCFTFYICVWGRLFMTETPCDHSASKTWRPLLLLLPALAPV